MEARNDKWGFATEKSNLVNLDRTQRGLHEALAAKVPGFRACLFCGSCSATCTVIRDGMNFRYLHLLLLRGDLQEAASIAAPCLLCGKCTLVCPRNVDTRAVLYNLKIMLHEYL